MSQEKVPVSPSSDDSANLARRAFLEKAGKLAAYTPPTMLALMYPGMHAVASGTDSPGKKKDKKDKKVKLEYKKEKLEYKKGKV